MIPISNTVIFILVRDRTNSDKTWYQSGVAWIAAATTATYNLARIVPAAGIILPVELIVGGVLAYCAIQTCDDETILK